MCTKQVELWNKIGCWFHTCLSLGSAPESGVSQHFLKSQSPPCVISFPTRLRCGITQRLSDLHAKVRWCLSPAMISEIHNKKRRSTHRKIKNCVDLLSRTKKNMKEANKKFCWQWATGVQNSGHRAGQKMDFWPQRMTQGFPFDLRCPPPPNIWIFGAYFLKKYIILILVARRSDLALCPHVHTAQKLFSFLTQAKTEKNRSWLLGFCLDIFRWGRPKTKMHHLAHSAGKDPG